MGRQPLPTNTILGNGSDQYRIDTVLGPGGFGVTYLARDMRFDRDVAIKEYFPADFAYREGSTTIRSTTRGGDQNFFEQGKRQFLDEARTLAKFRHEHIVRVLNLFEQFNTAYMVLEFEEGQSLKNWLRALGHRPSQAEIDEILDPLLSALEVVHAKGMFHRDIAPDNIIVRPNGKPVLIDFGAARNFVREHSHTIGAIVKHGFSPPEQYTLDTKLQGAWSDIYALSATIYAALVGTPPDEASRRQLNDTLLPIEGHVEPHRRELYRRSFYAALNAGLALKPRDRPQTIRDLRAILRSDDAHYREPELAAAQAIEVNVADARRPFASAATFSRPSGLAASARPHAPGPSYEVVRSVPELAQAVEETAERAHRAASNYPEGAGRVAAITALIVAAIAAASFLWIGGIEHPGGLAAAMLVCAGVIVVAGERTLALARVAPADVGRATISAAVTSVLAMAVYWLPFFFWQISAALAAVSVLFVVVRLGRWVPVTLLGLALLHLAAAALLVALSTRSVQKDPFFLPLMGGSLAVLGALVLTCALVIQRRLEAARS
ncbi:MAG: serine/threonine protein kinase [Hyphomicrobiaceae bacterium]